MTQEMAVRGGQGGMELRCLVEMMGDCGVLPLSSDEVLQVNGGYKGEGIVRGGCEAEYGGNKAGR